MQTSNISERYHSLDALRGFALLLGVVFHSAESFCPERYSWAVVDVNAHWLFDWFQHLCHSFRMELFFIIAGFFAHMSFHKKGLRKFTENRLMRIVVPFFVGWCFLFPIFGWIWMTGFAQEGRLGDMGVPVAFQHLPAWKLTIGGILTAGFWTENFNLIHLWFLHQLLVVYALVIGVRLIFSNIFDHRLYVHMTSMIDRGMDFLVRSKMAWTVLPILTIPILFTMDGWGVDTPNKSMVPHVPTTLLYGFCFILGWVFHRRRELLNLINNSSLGWGGIALGILLSFATNRFDAFTHLMGISGMGDEWRHGLYLTLYAFMMWSLIIGFIALFNRYATRESEIWTYIAESSYWIYLVHHIVVVPLQISVAELDFPSGLKFIYVVVCSMIILFPSYHLFVRFTWLGKMLNGKQHSRPRIFLREARS